jgi:hypothetical protein
MATPETDELRNGREDGRGASGGKIFNGRGKNGNDNLWGRLERNGGHDDRNLNIGGINVAVGEHRDRTVVVGFAGVLVDQFVQFGARRHRDQQQDERDKQRGENRLAGRSEMTQMTRF